MRTATAEKDLSVVDRRASQKRRRKIVQENRVEPENSQPSSLHISLNIRLLGWEERLPSVCLADVQLASESPAMAREEAMTRVAKLNPTLKEKSS